MSFQREREVDEGDWSSQSARGPSNKCANESLAGRILITVTGQQVELVTLLLTSLNPAALWECLRFRSKQEEREDHAEEKGHYAIQTGSTQRHGCGIRSYRRRGRRGVSGAAVRVSDAILLPEDKRRHACELKPLYLQLFKPLHVPPFYILNLVL